jgi:hypothetical protein
MRMRVNFHAHGNKFLSAWKFFFSRMEIFAHLWRRNALRLYGNDDGFYPYQMFFYLLFIHIVVVYIGVKIYTLAAKAGDKSSVKSDTLLLAEDQLF